MSKFGGKSGGTVPTRLVRDKKKTKKAGEEKTVKAGADKAADAGAALDELESAAPATIKAESAKPQAEEAPAATDVPTPTDPKKTVVYRGGKGSAADAGPDPDTPVVGWLVVVDGPGRGSSINISYGLSKLGRGENQEVALAFGDDEISRENHAAIEFDPKTREFFLSKGENLVYLNGSRVGQGSEAKLESGDRIEVGATKLAFVPFCGPAFDWNDE